MLQQVHSVLTPLLFVIDNVILARFKCFGLLAFSRLSIALPRGTAL